MAQEDHAHGPPWQPSSCAKDSAQPTGAVAGEVLAVGMGLHTGEVAVGGFAEGQALAATVMGETALLATALQEVAEPETMLCSAVTARLIQGLVDPDPMHRCH